MFVSLLAAAALAQQPPGVGTRDPLARPRPPARRVVREAPAPAPTIQATGSNQPIAGIAFKGTDAPAQVAAAAETFIGRPATSETLTELAGALSRAYEKTDIALYTIAIPEQNFADGVVEVLLSEGSVGRVDIKASDGQTFPLLAAIAGKLTSEKPLSRGRYERQLSLMRSIPGLDVEPAFANEDGDDILDMTLTPKQQRGSGGVGINNWGPDLVGDVLLNGGVDFFRLLRDGDQLSFEGAVTRDFKRYRQLGASYAMPIGVDGLTLGASGAWLRTRPRNTDIRGTAKLAAVSLSYPILRSFTRAADVSLGVDGVNSDNAAFGNVIASERSRAVRLAGAYASAGDKHELSAQTTLSRGIDLFGARTIEPISEASFGKVAATATYQRNFTARLLGRVSASGQYSGDRLPAAELFAAGGPSIGRAFDNAFLTGDRGLGGFVELAYRPLASGRLSTSEIYAFGDWASLTLNRRGPLPRQHWDLASAGGGARLRFSDRIELGVEAATVLDRPYPAYSDDHRVSFYYTVGL